jgi:hypothetical protein
MRHLLAATAIVALLSAPALADPPFENGQQQQQGQLQGQKQGQLQGQLQGQKQKAVGVGVGVGVAGVKNSGSTVTVEGDDYDPPAYAPNVNLFSPTTKCYVPLGGSMGALGVVSLGLGGAYEDENCTAIEKAKACTEAMKVFSDMASQCREMWKVALMTVEEKTAYRETKAARLALRKRHSAASAAPISLLSSGERITWNGPRVGGVPVE